MLHTPDRVGSQDTRPMGAQYTAPCLSDAFAFAHDGAGEVNISLYWVFKHTRQDVSVFVLVTVFVKCEYVCFSICVLVCLYIWMCCILDVSECKPADICLSVCRSLCIVYFVGLHHGASSRFVSRCVYDEQQTDRPISGVGRERQACVPRLPISGTPSLGNLYSQPCLSAWSSASGGDEDSSWLQERNQPRFVPWLGRMWARPGPSLIPVRAG